MARKRRKSTEERESKFDYTFTFPRGEKAIILKLKPIDLRYLAELIDIYLEHFPEFYKPLFNKILKDLPKIVELSPESIEIDVNQLSNPKPYSPGCENCNPLTFSELRELIDKLIMIFGLLPEEDFEQKILSKDVARFYNSVFTPENTFFTLRNDELLVLKVEPLDMLDAAEILDKIQHQLNEITLARQVGRKPKQILTQKWLFEKLIPQFPKLLVLHPKSPVQIDISKTGSFKLNENPLYPFEINRLIDLILKVSGVLPETLQSFPGESQ